jgi:hypothetical protein
VVNYRSNPVLPLFPQYPQSSSSSASTGRSHVAPSSSSRPPYQAAFYPAHPLAHPPLRMSPLGGSSQRSCAYTCTSTMSDRTRTCTSTSSSSSGSFLIPWNCSFVKY